VHLRLKSANLDDLELLAEMNKRLIEDEGSSNPMSLLELQERMRGFLAADWLADMIMRNEDIVGYALYRFNPHLYDAGKKNVYLRQYFIKREYRRQGIGLLGLEMLKEQRFGEVETLEIDVLSDNASGREFWTKVGLTPYSINMRTRLG